ncbi:sulfatase family protein [Sunxiuqinia sp. A32]|uniref:sulfatase family protein n=1 Tax=Sunxiuqinia sp. A32 TaxID=3461496 RepID=UPI0040465F0A
MRNYIIWFFLLVMFLNSCSHKSSEDKPNILFLFADDWGKYASCYKNIDGENSINAIIETPNIDRIAEQGIIFTNSHAPAPSCTPCRSSLLSGQYFYKTGRGAILHAAVWDDAIPSYPLILRDNGYHIGYAFKVWSPGNPVNAPYGGDKYRYEPAGKNFNHFSQYVSEHENIEKAKQDLLNEVKQNFLAFLNDKKEGQPFCYWFGPTNTHRPWVQGSGKALWGLNPDKLKERMPDFLPDVPEIREDFNDYLGEVLAWDAGVGAIIEALKEAGQLNNTIIVLSGDHGIPGFPRAKTNLYELGTHVALIVSSPGKYEGGRVVDDFVNLMDLAPTFLEMAGVTIPKVMNGKSLVPLLESADSGCINAQNKWVFTGRERHVGTAREDNLPYPQRAIKNKDFLYIRNFKPERLPIGPLEKGLRDIDGGPTKNWFVLNHDNPAYKIEWELAFGLRPYEELYDLKKDPFEMKNLAAFNEYAEIKNELSEMMDSIMNATGDPRIINDNCIFDAAPYTDVNKSILTQQKKIQEEIQQLLNE